MTEPTRPDTPRARRRSSTMTLLSVCHEQLCALVGVPDDARELRAQLHDLLVTVSDDGMGRALHEVQVAQHRCAAEQARADAAEARVAELEGELRATIGRVR